MKKLIFLPLCLSLCLAPLAQAQQPSNHETIIEQLSQQDINDFAQSIEQLPDKQREILEKALETKDLANILLSFEIKPQDIASLIGPPCFVLGMFFLYLITDSISKMQIERKVENKETPVVEKKVS